MLLRSVPGIGTTTAALLAASIGDIARFAAPEAPVASIGTDPRVSQSGVSVHGEGGIPTRGHNPLRGMLFQAAFIIQNP